MQILFIMGEGKNQSLVSPELNRLLAEKLNDEMKSAVLPVTAFVGLEAGFGFCGNIMILFVFLTRYHVCNFKYFVLCLAFIDTTSILTTLPGEIVTHMFWYVYPVPVVCKIKSFFNMFTVCGSAFCLLLIAVDRFRKICQPLKWQIKPKMAFILCLVALIVSFILALPVPFLWGVHSYEETYKLQTINVTVCELDAKFKATDYPDRYSISMKVILCFVMLIMFILYIFVCRKLFWMTSETPEPFQQTADEQYLRTEGKTGVPNEDNIADQKVLPSRNNRPIIRNESVVITKEMEPLNQEKSRKQQKWSRIRRKTVIMLILTAVFIFTTILYLILLNLITNGILESLSSTKKAIYFFFFRLYFINHVVNPVLYGFLDQHFRRELKKIVKLVLCRNVCASARTLSETPTFSKSPQT